VTDAAGKAMGKKKKIFGIGAHKTGTKSLAAALNLLGLKVVHLGTDLRRSRSKDILRSHLDCIDDIDGCVDFPVSLRYREVAERYPGSRFILTVRDEHTWIGSVERHFAYLMRTFGELPPADREFYGNDTFGRDVLLARYRKHNEDAVRYFEGRTEKLLIFDIVGGEGWERLSPWLSLETPDRPFPWIKQGGR
jgi:hypothetical protein